MIYLTLTEALHVAERTLGVVQVSDVGLLESALARPRASAFGKDAYPTFTAKAAALMHSVARNRALVDGNKRLSLAVLVAFAGMNGYRLTMTNEEAYTFIMAIAAGVLNTVPEIVGRLEQALEPW